MTIMTRSQYKIYTKRFPLEVQRDMEHLQERVEYKASLPYLKYEFLRKPLWRLRHIYNHPMDNILGPIFK